MRTLFPVPILLCLVAPALAESEDPVLITSHEACFVHAVPGWPPATRDYIERVVAPGHVLLRTSRETGEMTRLLEATGTVAVNTRRISYQVTRLLGVVADAERLYALLWYSGRIFDRPPEAGAALEGGRYELRVFWLADGRRLQARSLGPEGLPGSAPPASVGAGPLKLVPGGVSCFGTKARYDGATLRED